MRTIKLLSLDGGGARGIFHIYFLNELEKLLKKPCREIFDYIGGTSIGGIVSLLLTHPIRAFNNSNNFMLEDVVRAGIPETMLKAFFSPEKYKGIFPRAGVVGPSYSDLMPKINDYLQNVLFGNNNFGVGDNIQKTMVFAYDTHKVKGKVFKSWAPEDQKYSASIVAKATSAAPTYFPSVPHAEGNWVDGGVFANDPSLFLNKEVEVLNRHDDDIRVVVVSLGLTREAPGISYEEIGNAGVIGWGRKITDVIFNAQHRSTEYLNGHIDCKRCCAGCFENAYNFIGNEPNVGFYDYHIQDDKSYYKFAPKFPATIAFTDPALLHRLVVTAHTFFNNRTETFNKLIEDLTS